MKSGANFIAARALAAVRATRGKPPTAEARVADAGERIAELVASDPGIGIGLLAAAVYGEDTPVIRNRICALFGRRGCFADDGVH